MPEFCEGRRRHTVPTTANHRKKKWKAEKSNGNRYKPLLSLLEYGLQ